LACAAGWQRLRTCNAMKNFLRALKYAWPYRYRMLVSVVCALLAAVLWGLNFTAIYPVLKMLGGEDNLQTWVNRSIDKVTTEQIKPQEITVNELKEKLETIENKPPGPQRDTERRRATIALADEERKLDSSRYELYRYQVAKRFIDMLLPEGRFQTLALMLLVVVIAVAVKGVFEFFQETLVGNV